MTRRFSHSGRGTNYISAFFSHIWWWYIPARCYNRSCKRWFRRDFFWNPWGPGSGPGLTCSEECCDAVKIKYGLKR